MSVNQRFAIDQSKVAKWGKYFGGIDFEVASVSKASLSRMGKSAVAGEFILDEKKYRFTLEELDEVISECRMGTFRIKKQGYEYTQQELMRIIETCENAKQVFFQKYRLGL